jgi:Domain of unknown function (DUF4395)
MQKIFQFGEEIPGYNIPVLNERAVRAAAGILFFFAMITFMNAWLVGNFEPTRIFVVAFLLDFSIRLFINPLWAPSMIVGQWAVRKQQPEYAGAPQKRFAWAIGFMLALSMLYLIVIQGVIGPINMLVCGTCLILMFFETAFGICIGCKIYNTFSHQKAELCPGGVCEYQAPAGAGGNWRQGMVVVVFLSVVIFMGQWLLAHPVSSVHRAQSVGRDAQQQTGPEGPVSEDSRCVVPAFAKALGHEEKWRLHNNCL